MCVLLEMTLPIQRSFLDSIKWSGWCLLHCSFVGLVIFLSLVFLLQQSHSVFWNSQLRRRIYRISFLFSFFLSLNNYLCMFTYRYILPSFETASQFQSWRLLVVTRCVQFRTGALTSHPFHWTWKYITLFIYFCSHPYVRYKIP